MTIAVVAASRLGESGYFRLTWHYTESNRVPDPTWRYRITIVVAKAPLETDAYVELTYVSWCEIYEVTAGRLLSQRCPEHLVLETAATAIRTKVNRHKLWLQSDDQRSMTDTMTGGL